MKSLMEEYLRLRRIVREIELSEDRDSIVEAFSALRSELSKMKLPYKIVFYITFYVPLRIKYRGILKRGNITKSGISKANGVRYAIRDEELNLSLSPCGRLILISLALNRGYIPLDLIYAKAMLLRLRPDEVMSTIGKMESLGLIVKDNNLIRLTLRGVMVLDKVLSIEISSLKKLIVNLEQIRKNIKYMFDSWY